MSNELVKGKDLSPGAKTLLTKKKITGCNEINFKRWHSIPTHTHKIVCTCRYNNFIVVRLKIVLSHSQASQWS